MCGVPARRPAGRGPSAFSPCLRSRRRGVGELDRGGFSPSVWGCGSARQRARRPREAQVSTSPHGSSRLLLGDQGAPPPSGSPFPESVAEIRAVAGLCHSCSLLFRPVLLGWLSQLHRLSVQMRPCLWAAAQTSVSLPAWVSTSLLVPVCQP